MVVVKNHQYKGASTLTDLFRRVGGNRMGSCFAMSSEAVLRAGKFRARSSLGSGALRLRGVLRAGGSGDGVFLISGGPASGF